MPENRPGPRLETFQLVGKDIDALHGRMGAIIGFLQPSSVWSRCHQVLQGQVVHQNNKGMANAVFVRRSPCAVEYSRQTSGAFMFCNEAKKGGQSPQDQTFRDANAREVDCGLKRVDNF